MTAHYLIISSFLHLAIVLGAIIVGLIAIIKTPGLIVSAVATVIALVALSVRDYRTTALRKARTASWTYNARDQRLLNKCNRQAVPLMELMAQNPFAYGRAESVLSLFAG